MQTKRKVSGTKTYLPLMGGLGNQLFQMYAGNQFASNSLICDETLFLPFADVVRKIDVKDYIWPLKVTFSRFEKPNFLLLKGSNLLIRIISSNLNLPTKRAIAYTLRIFLTPLFCLRYQSLVKLVVPLDVGYSEIRHNPKRNSVLVGYFQSSKYFEEFSSVFSLNLKPSRTDIQYEEIRDESIVKSPMIVHIRLGDFLKEAKPRTLRRDYYSDHLEEAFFESGAGAIWLFSDDLEAAKSLIPINLQRLVTVFEKSDLSPSQLLELMRLGSSYFLSNSTLSWWAAYTSINVNPKVFAPARWLENQPNDLTISTWKLLNNKF